MGPAVRIRFPPALSQVRTYSNQCECWVRRPVPITSLLVIGFGIFRFVNRRHPRMLARIPPTQLGLWSFAVAIAHGAGLMLGPIYLGLCQAAGPSIQYAATGALINNNLAMAVLVAVVHSL